MIVKTKTYIHEHRVDNRDHQHLKEDSEYTVIGIDDENFRIINDIGEPVLYPKTLFIVLDPIIPKTWVKEEFEDGEYHVNPLELSSRGFYEKYFEKDTKAVKIFKKFIKENKL